MPGVRMSCRHRLRGDAEPVCGLQQTLRAVPARRGQERGGPEGGAGSRWGPRSEACRGREDRAKDSRLAERQTARPVLPDLLFKRRKVRGGSLLREDGRETERA